MDTFRLPEGAKASLVKVKGASGTFRIQAAIPGKTLGHHTMFKNIAVKSPKISDSKRRSPRTIKNDNGIRPLHLTVNFIPKKVELKPHERACPPFDFDYRKDGEILDRPTCVFPPDQRYIYLDTNFPWRTVGRVDTPLGGSVQVALLVLDCYSRQITAFNGILTIQLVGCVSGQLTIMVRFHLVNLGRLQLSIG